MQDFNPIKQEVDGKRAHRVIWSTKALELALDGLSKGRKLVANPFYENDVKLLKGDLVFSRTDAEIAEFKLCATDIIHFGSICKLMTPLGIQHVTLRDYQKDYLEHLMKNQLSIFLSCRQSGKTTTSAIFLLHYALFNVDKNALVLGNKLKTAVEILDKIKKIYLELPYFLKPGIYKWNETEIVFDNGCRIMAEATTINSGISFTYHCVLADEFAHISPTILDKFYNNLFPTITAGKAKFIITSTQNGYNLFYRLYTAAVAGENDYKPFKVDWYQVPEWDPDTKSWTKRDEAWHQHQIANYGSEEAFNAQFGTNFDISSNTLINNKILRRKEKEVFEFVNVEGLKGTTHEEMYFWHPNYDVNEQLKKDFIVITIDIAEGVAGDSTVYTFNKISGGEESPISTTIGYFKCNTMSIKNCAEELCRFCQHNLIMNNYVISLEWNTYGEVFMSYVMKYINELKLDEIYQFNEDSFLKYFNEEHTKFKYGVRLTSKSKFIGVMQFKEKYETNIVNNVSAQFMNELNNFADSKGNNTYAASFGHDDLVMSQMHIVYVLDNFQFHEFYSAYLEAYESPLNQNYEAFNPYEMNMEDIQQNPMYSQYFDYRSELDGIKLANMNRLRGL